MGARFELSRADRVRLERLVANGNTAQKHVRRARIILLTAAGLSNAEIARQSSTAVLAYAPMRRLLNAGGPY